MRVFKFNILIVKRSAVTAVEIIYHNSNYVYITIFTSVRLHPNSIETDGIVIRKPIKIVSGRKVPNVA